MKNLLNTILAFILVACTEHPVDVTNVDTLPPIYPDYVGVTIPAEIAPLNFSVEGVETVEVTAEGSIGGEMTANGEWADFDIERWHSLVRQNIGGSLKITVYAKERGKWLQYEPFEIYVSNKPMPDYGVTYRRIAPGFETFSNLGIYQRCLANFDEEAILESRAVDGGCMNCHYSNRGNPDQFSLHIRGKHGCTIIRNEDGDKYINTKSQETIGSCTYGYWHKGGRYCVYSLNRIYQNFYVGKDKTIEPWDAVSDIAVLDTKTNELTVSPVTSTKDFETTPSFSADGTTIYFCKAPYVEMPAGYEKVKYSLCSVSFDGISGRVGDTVSTIIDAGETGKSLSLPRPSYDGRWLMYCMTDFGTTPLNRMECDLYLLDLQSGKTRLMEEVNSEDADAYHNWSGGGEGWFLFGSKREDHLYSLLYFACVDETGKATKPFLMPQRNPKKYYRDNLYSFNAPDFTTKKVELDVPEARAKVMSEYREQVKVKH